MPRWKRKGTLRDATTELVAVLDADIEKAELVLTELRVERRGLQKKLDEEER